MPLLDFGASPRLHNFEIYLKRVQTPTISWQRYCCFRLYLNNISCFWRCPNFEFLILLGTVELDFIDFLIFYFWCHGPVFLAIIFRWAPTRSSNLCIGLWNFNIFEMFKFWRVWETSVYLEKLLAILGSIFFLFVYLEFVEFYF